MAKCSRCGEKGASGRPALCAECYSEQMYASAEDSVLNTVLQHEVVQQAVDRGIDAVNVGVNKILERLDGYARMAAQFAMAQSQAQAKPTPVKKDHRAILHFGPTEVLTEQKISDRRRALAALCHPDKAGDVEAMQLVNEAADALLKEIA